MAQFATPRQAYDHVVSGDIIDRTHALRAAFARRYKLARRVSLLVTRHPRDAGKIEWVLSYNGSKGVRHRASGVVEDTTDWVQLYCAWARDLAGWTEFVIESEMAKNETPLLGRFAVRV